MSFRILQAAFIFLGGIFLSSPGNGNKTEGYRSVIRYDDGFLAAGSGGQIDWISVSGLKTRSEKFPAESFNCLLEFNQMVIVAGERGSILVSTGKGIFRKAESGTSRNINSLAEFRGVIIAGADQGEIIAGDGSGSFRKIHLDLKGNIVSVSARASDCFGVTDEGEIIHTTNGTDWEITDFNKVYSGYYKSCSFKRVLVTENRIVIAGVNIDGSPVLMFSNQGNVWAERPLNYTDDEGEKGFLTEIPNDIFYEESGDNFYLACSKGKVMQLPSCTQCNKLAVISTEDLEGISSSNNTMVFVGGNFLIKTIGMIW